MSERRYSRSDTPRPRQPRGGSPAPRARSSRSAGAQPQTRKAPRNPRPSAPKKPRRWLKTLAVIAALFAVVVGVAGCAMYRSISSDLPDPDIRKAKGRDQSSVILDKDGKTLARLFAEQNRQDVALDKMPKYLPQAVIATEDQRFYEHEGVDPLGIARAIAVDVMKRSKAQGGSTITQQYVKQAFVTSEKTLKRKVQEAVLAQRVEQRYSKNEILELYLNTIYFGHGAYGVEAASRAYFGKGVEKLTIPEAAMIAGVIKSPGRYSPYLDMDAATTRRNTVLMQMRAQNYITEAEYQDAKNAPVEVAGLKPPSTRAPYFVEWVKEALVKKFGQKAVYRGGLRVETTLDPKAQKIAEKATREALNRDGDPSAALVAMSPKTGAVVAMVGGKDFKTQQFNVAVQGTRQPGSSFKPFVLATALEKGVSPEQGFKSGPRTFNINGQTWKVTGAHSGGGGLMRLRKATEQSVNSVFAQLILDVGAKEVVSTVEKLGIREGIKPVPAIALGGLDEGVSPLEMATAYSAFAAGGQRPTPYGVAKVTGPDGTVLLEAEPKGTRAIKADVAYLTTDILKGVIKRGTGTAAQIGRPAAGKTGTTQQYRDAWFVGYTPDLTCAVWVGHPDSQREMLNVHGRKVTGGSFPAQIWARFMRNALAGKPSKDFTRPAGLVSAKVCSESGMTPTEFCPKTVSALVLARHKPKSCTVHTKPVEVKVPNVVGMTKADAMAALEDLGLVVTVTEQGIAGVAPGVVGSQNPPAGTILKPKDPITIFVSVTGAANQPPVAAFTAPASGKAGEVLALDASGSTDDGSISQFYWEFGDDATGSGQKVSHAWSTPGTYEVTLWVTDNSGTQSSVSKTIQIK
ncbi:MAG TPA: PBP1A family penicillin-binding protein [Coriobacteriia bacterium]|nr:PBP1A family penicillin-binding protein [Coriobacteriia bacterium]